MNIIFVSTDNYMIIFMQTPGTELSIWKIFVKHGQGVQISCNCQIFNLVICLFKCLRTFSIAVGRTDIIVTVLLLRTVVRQ